MAAAAAPAWLQPEVFEQDDFDHTQYVSDFPKSIPLDSLRTALEKHVQSLRNELIELINRDYSDFVSLSTRLSGVDTAVDRFQAPLGEIREKIVGIREEIQEQHSILCQQLQARAEASTVRSTLELLLNTSHVVSKVDKLLEEIQTTFQSAAADDDSSPSPPPPDTASKARLIERVASEINRLRFYCSRGAELPLVAKMESKAENAESAVKHYLNATLGEALREASEPAVFHCFNAYAALHIPEAAESVVREEIVKGVVEAALAATDAKSGLGDILETILERVSDKCGYLIALTKNSEDLNIAGGAVVAEVQDMLGKHRVSAFSAGNPSAFREAYNATVAFLEGLEGLCPTLGVVQSFRKHPSVTALIKRFNTSVYFTLRFQEIAGAVESSISNIESSISAANAAAPIMLPPAPKEENYGFRLQISASLWKSLQRCWSEDVYINICADKFLKLTFQLLSRFRTALSNGLDVQEETTDSAHSWGALSTESLLFLRHDVELLKSRGQREFATMVGLQFHHLQHDLKPQIQKALEEVTSVPMDEFGKETVLRAASAIGDKCLETLKQLRGITATYRMTNKPLPTKPSHFVPAILNPLHNVVDSAESQVGELNQGTRQELVDGVVQKVTVKYQEMAEELITTVRKTESSLLKLRSRREAQGDQGDQGESQPESTKVTDTEKICTQLHLDVQEYGRQLERFGIDPEELPTYKALLECVKH